MEWLKKIIEKHTKDGVLNQEELNKEINTEFPKHAVPKETYNTLAETKKKLEEDITSRDKQLEELKKVDAKGLQAEITRLQEENKTAKEKFNTDMKELQLNNSLKLNIAGKVHDPDIVLNLLDKAKIELDEQGNVKSGLEEQLKSLKETKAFLFAEKQEPTITFKGIKPVEGKDKDGNPLGVGASFAQSANEGTKPTNTAPNPWGN